MSPNIPKYTLKYIPNRPSNISSNIGPNISSNASSNIVGLRFFNVYGSNEFYKGKTASMVIQLAHQILDGNSPRLFKGSDNIKRDFIYIEDVIQALVNSCTPKKSGIYNVGTGISRSFLDIVNILQKNLETNLKIQYFPNPFSGYQVHTQANIKDTKTFLNFVPKFSLENGIKDYLPEIKRLHGKNNK